MEDRKLIQYLKNKYRGLREEDLHQGNPEYSCCICGNENCEYIGDISHCCPDSIPATEEQFSFRYNFLETRED